MLFLEHSRIYSRRVPGTYTVAVYQPDLNFVCKSATQLTDSTSSIVQELKIAFQFNLFTEDQVLKLILLDLSQHGMTILVDVSFATSYDSLIHDGLVVSLMNGSNVCNMIHIRS